jgi:predicted nucleic acid-binding protein
MQEDIKRVTLDSNVLISAVKENEEYSKDCREILNFVGKSFIMYQPTLCITELYNAIGKTKGEPRAKKALKEYIIV